jgi:predicted nucleotide-binding protein (sugar kinase/HSP70/actin superfamily)
MRNVKMLARERARKLIEETLVRAKRQFRREMLNMLVEYDSMRDQVLKKDKDLVRVQALLIE